MQKTPPVVDIVWEFSFPALSAPLCCQTQGGLANGYILAQCSHDFKSTFQINSLSFNLTTVTSTRFYQILLYKYFFYDFWLWEAFALHSQIVFFFHADIYWILEFVIDLTIVFELQKTAFSLVKSTRITRLIVRVFVTMPKMTLYTGKCLLLLPSSYIQGETRKRE